jgi:hypothetical protein
MTELKMVKNPLDIKGTEDLENELGMKLGDTFEFNGHKMSLNVYNNMICYVYEALQPDPDEFSEYVLHATKASIVPDLFSNIRKDIPEEFINKCVKVGSQFAAEGRVGLKDFIIKMRERHNLHDRTDFSGDKFYVPLFGIAPDKCNGGC